jgi:glycosyltransferase involved in cell wall biosynthesis
MRKIAVLTTSYPRHAEDFAGRFVMDAAAELRRLGIEVEIVSPGVYRTFGLDVDGGGFVAQVRRRPWIAPLIFVSMVRALRRAARDADLVHVHWLAGALVGALSGRPFVVTLHGTGSAGRFQDLELARRWPRLVGLVLRRAQVVIGVSQSLADAARRCGVADARWVPNGVALPEALGFESDPPYVLYAGRLSAEKGIEDLVEATRGLPLVVAGDGPLRELVPDALGFVGHDRLEQLYAGAAVVVTASHGEGMPLCVIEAMAYGRPVVATAVGGIPSLVDDGRTGFLVEPGDVPALRARIEKLLADADLRRRMGEAARQKVAGLCAWDVVTAQTLEAYRSAVLRRAA